MKLYIAEHRKALHWTQGRLAREAEVHASQLSEWESGQVLPGLPALAKLAGGLGVDIADLFSPLPDRSGP